jgi:hypothetical protein
MRVSPAPAFTAARHHPEHNLGTGMSRSQLLHHSAGLAKLGQADAPIKVIDLMGS